jgi:elongator complex protein 1
VANPEANSAADKIVNLHHFSGSLATCTVFGGGDIVLVQEDDSLRNAAHVEVVGSVDAKITAARWSPDEELLCLTTDADTVVLMSRSFDGIGEATMTVEDLGLSKHVSVGWGKKETQFRGKGAKALRDPTIPETVDEGLPSRHEDGTTSISWRGDGAFVAVNSPLQGSRRAIRVYTRDAVLDSVSEPVNGLEGSVSWRPAGNLIAGIQRWKGTAQVVFFERNGLRHGEFALRIHVYPDEGSKKSRIGLEWNSDSTVLAVILEDAIQLWTVANYHWYLKQSVCIQGLGSLLAWHPEKSLVFANACPAGSVAETTEPEESLDRPIGMAHRLTIQECIFTVARGGLNPPHDDGAVAVIDGSTVKLTLFKQANVPPPMALYEIALDSNVIDVAFDETSSQLVVLQQSNVTLFDLSSTTGISQAPQRKAVAKLARNSSSAILFEALQVCLVNKDHVAILLDDGFRTAVSFFQLAQRSSNILHFQEQVAMPRLINLGRVAGLGSGSFCQDVAGGFHTGLSPDLRFILRLPHHLPWLEAQLIAQDTAAVPVGLAKNGHLCAGTRVLVKNCTSFLVTPDHILLTTSNSLLKCIHLQEVSGRFTQFIHHKWALVPGF